MPGGNSAGHKWPMWHASFTSAAVAGVAWSAASSVMDMSHTHVVPCTAQVVAVAAEEVVEGAEVEHLAVAVG